MSSRTFDRFSILDTVTRLVIRTTYGFMAGIIGLFLASLCVIKAVRSLFHHYFVQYRLSLHRDKKSSGSGESMQSVGAGASYKGNINCVLVTLILPHFNVFFFVPAALAVSCLPYLSSIAKMVSDVGFLHALRRITTNRSHSIPFSTQLFGRYSVKLEKSRNYNLHLGIAIDLT
jgi:hypothetical protein